MLWFRNSQDDSFPFSPKLWEEESEVTQVFLILLDSRPTREPRYYSQHKCLEMIQKKEIGW